MERNSWTKDEIEFIKNKYTIMSDLEISKYLKNHSEISVATKRKRLGLKRQKLKHSFDDVVNAFSKTDYKLLSKPEDFKDTATNSLKYICPHHRNKGIQTISLNHLEHGRGCYWCGRNITEAARRVGLSDESIAEDIRMCKKRNLKYVESVRIDGLIYIGFVCDKHKKVGIQYTRRGNMKRSEVEGCKYCLDKKKFKFSKGEKRIENYLKLHNINYVPQYSFNDCRDILTLPFDFYLIDKNIICEYDGQHHYMPVNFNGKSDEEAKEHFLYVQRHDKIKNEYCEKHNIKIIRIPYWDYKNIEKILDKEIA